PDHAGIQAFVFWWFFALSLVVWVYTIAVTLNRFFSHGRYRGYAMMRCTSESERYFISRTDTVHNLFWTAYVVMYALTFVEFVLVKSQGEDILTLTAYVSVRISSP